ncbi:MAG: hypothetical protein EHM48_06815 [Planctomycetaceae bacterium]|nr:MAG: hypothetical protein EHM48_06815 [Planctomycetaceae bacterium]
MRWDEESQDTTLPVRGYRPVADTIIPPGRRFRDPDVQAEVERRLAIYIEQVERTGRIKWLPRRGSGK